MRQKNRIIIRNFVAANGKMVCFTAFDALCADDFQPE
jgi:hypothetical protein